MKAISIKERSLILERVIYADEDLQEVPLEYRERWEYLEEASEAKRSALHGKQAGSLGRGGGGWPSTAARSP
ncbi:hypothetical protein TB2_013093 [Malus domestica]